jgi:acyl carrier protein
MDARKELLGRIRVHFPPGIDPSLELHDDSVLADFGLTSLHLITLVLTLQDEYGLEIDDLVEHGMPVTVGDLLTLVEHKAPALSG